MSDVSSLFAKKKKKKKSKKKDGKKSKSTLASAADPGAAPEVDSSTSGGWSGASTTQYKSMFGSDAAAKLKTQLMPEKTENDIKFEGMTEENYKNHVDQEKGKKEFHKARKLAELKAKKAAELKAKPASAAAAAAAPAVKTSWRDRQKSRIAASSGNIRSQLGNASHFPSLGGKSKTAVVAGAWGSVDVDEEALREVEQTLHEQDPEVMKQRAAEAARQAKLEEIKRNTWQPSAEEGGVDESLTDEKITKSIKSMVREFLNIDDKKEAMLCIKELRNPSKHDFVCQRLFEEAFETLGGEDDLRKIAGLIVSMRRNKPFLLTKEQLDDTISFLEECMDDIKVDIPKAPERFEFMIQQLKLKQVIADSKGKKFILSVKFDGAKEGYDYKMGAQGMGYYLQIGGGGSTSATAAPVAPKATRPSIFGGAKPRTVSQPPTAASKPAAKKADPFGGARARPDPFGGAIPRTTKPAAAAAVTKPALAKKSNPFGDAKPVKTRTDPFGGARPVKTRADPFGGAKPVATKKPNPFGDAKPVKTRSDPFGGARPVKTRSDPFGGAKPVEEKKPGAAPAVPVAEDKAALEQAFGKKKKKKKKKKAYVPDA